MKCILRGLRALEKARRFFDPGLMPYLRDRMQPFAPPLEEALMKYEAQMPGGGDRDDYNRAARLVLGALKLFTGEVETQDALPAFMSAMRKAARAQEALFPFRKHYAAVDEFFLETPPGALGETPHDDEGSETGLFHVGCGDDPYERGGYSLYVPGVGKDEERRFLVVALHGGYGHGRDFIWMWLREARSRGFVLLAPSSRGWTWSITGVDGDAEALTSVVHRVADRWNITPDRMLITGISDGGTYLLRYALRSDSLFTSLAPLSCVLPPADLSGAGGKRICWVHGALDWIFPVSLARRCAGMLREANADVEQHILEDLSHTYPREMNDPILTWFDPSLRLKQGA